MTDAGLQGLIGKEQGAKSHSREPIKRGSSRKGAGLTPEGEKGLFRKTSRRPGAAGTAESEQEGEVGQEEVGGWRQGSRLGLTASWALVRCLHFIRR